MHAKACALIAVVVGLGGQGFADPTRGFDYIVIDGVRIPFGTTIEVSGPPGKRTAGLHLDRLNGKPNQDDFDVRLQPSNAGDEAAHERLNRLTRSGYHKIRGRLVSARAVGPRRELGLVVERIEEIPAAPLTIADFADRLATFEGTARSGGQVQTDHGVAQIDAVADWPKSVDGKRISVRGLVRRRDGEWHIEQPAWHLVELGDELGETVTLEGTLRSSNGNWWFEYRADKLYLISERGPILQFAGSDHGRRVRASGRLVRQDRPSLDNINYGFGAALVPSYVLRGAKVEYLEERADWDSRFEPLYFTFHTVRDGVAELLPEYGFRRNMNLNETDARLYLERNAEVVNSVLRDATPEKRDVLARRMADPNLAEPLRLIYAGMLMWLDDARGRAFLLSRTDPEGSPTIEALFCLGAFLESRPANAIQWAEQRLIALLRSEKLAHPERSGLYSFKQNKQIQQAFKDKQEYLAMVGIDPQTFTVSHAAWRFTEIPSVLLKINSATARRAVIDELVGWGKIEDSCPVIENLRLFDAPVPVDAQGVVDVEAWAHNARGPGLLLPVDDLLKLEAVTEGRYCRIALLSQLLRHKHSAAVDEFLADLKDSFTYMEIRDHSSPEVIAVLERRIPSLKGRARDHAEMLVLLAKKDPVPSLLELLQDKRSVDRNLVLYELSRLTDPRAVAPLGRLLKEAPVTFFEVGSQRMAEMAAMDGWTDVAKYVAHARKRTAATAVRHALDAIARAKSPAAIPELIECLAVDLSRFGTDDDRDTFRRGIATHLIGLTGESLGLEADAWRHWYREHSRALAQPPGDTRTRGARSADSK